MCQEDIVTAADAMDVASVLARLQRDHGIDPDPVFGPLRAEDFRFIAESVENDWNTHDTASNLAAIVKARVPPKEVT